MVAIIKEVLLEPLLDNKERFLQAGGTLGGGEGGLGSGCVCADGRWRGQCWCCLRLLLRARCALVHE